MTPRPSFKQGNEVHESLLYYRDKISSGTLLSAAFILLHLFTHSKPSMMAIDTMTRSRRETVTPVATGTVMEPCALAVTEGVLVVIVGEKDGPVTVAATDELKIDTLVGTAEQRILIIIIIIIIITS